jgi:DNA primase
MWHCFGCSEGGDVISFMQKIESTTFIEAIERLGAKVGIEVQYTDGPRPIGPPPGQRARHAEANELATQFYMRHLSSPEGTIGREYLAGRGFDSEATAAFEVGFSPIGWDSLTTFLKDKGFNEEELVLVGLAIKKEKNPGIYDRFRGRLMWPIRDLSGDVIGFGARKILDSDNGPKYLNTPETPLYHKSDVLYGIHSAKKHIASTKEVIVVEGYTDVMACHLSGIMNAVAACGTAFGDGHIKIIRRLMHDVDMFNGRVVFTFDGDAAGQKAAMRAFQENHRFTASTYVVVAPNGMDPAEVRSTHGAQGLRDLIGTAVPLAEFVLKTTISGYDLATIEGRTNALRACAPVLADIRDMQLRVQYVTQVGGWLGINERSVREAVSAASVKIAQDARKANATEGKASPVNAPASEPETASGSVVSPIERGSEPQASSAKPRVPLARPNPNNPNFSAEREALKCLLQLPDLTPGWHETLRASAFTHPSYLGVYQSIIGNDEEIDSVISHLITELTVEALPVHDISKLDESYTYGCLVRLRLKDYDREISHLKAQLARGEGDTDHLFVEILRVETLRRGLRSEE